MYEYRAKVIDVYDGDTITVDLDLGLGIWVRNQKLRLYGIDAPEVRGKTREEGIKSRDWLREQILGRTITVQTIKDKKGKYGRYLAHVFLPGTIESASKVMVSKGLAVYKTY